jgi:SAM-dependent methyltransferase
MNRLNEDKMRSLYEKLISYSGISMSVGMVYIGQKIGLFKAMADAGPLTSEEIAQRSRTVERYVREWLVNQVASGFVEYDPTTRKYTLPAEESVMFCDEHSSYYWSGFYFAKAVMQSLDRVAKAFQEGGGVAWSEHDPDLFYAVEHSYRPIYEQYLTTTWIPSLISVQNKLRMGGMIADIGCGRGTSTFIMARAYRNSKIFGFDYHEPSMLYAQKLAIRLGLDKHTEFVVASSDNFQDGPYDLITFCTSLHDMPDPISALKRSFETLNEGGSVLIVEPMAGNSVEENCNPLGQMFSAVSTLCCLSNSLAQGGSGLGAIATETEIHDKVKSAGFAVFRRIGESPVHRVYEARKN